MAIRKEETASFVVRFTQKIFQNDEGEPQVQWRGNIRHVQGGEEQRFSEFDEVVLFIQQKLADLTIQATEGKSPEEQQGILSKSFNLWKRMALDYPKMVIETIKDPKGSVEQIQEQVHQVGDLINAKLDPESWKPASKADLREVMDMMQQVSRELSSLNKKVDKLSKKGK